MNMMGSSSASAGPTLADLSNPQIAEELLADFLSKLREENSRAEQAKQHILDQSIEKAGALLIGTVAEVEKMINSARDDIEGRGIEAARLLTSAKSDALQSAIYKSRVVAILRS